MKHENYFELYALPVSFSPAPAQVKARYYELSRTYHPDRVAQADDDARNEANIMSSLNNTAYKTLTDADQLMAYVLQIKGVMTPDEKYQLPPEFLMEMMDLNEVVTDLEMEPGNAGLATQANAALSSQLTEWDNEVNGLIADYERQPDTITLLQIKDMYFRRKYLLRIKERIAKFAAR
jgi:molecular chaperone HscB